MFVFTSLDSTGEVRPVYSGLDAGLFLVLLAKYIIPFLVEQKHLEVKEEQYSFSLKTKLLSRKSHKKKDIFFASLRTCDIVQQA